MKNDKLIPDSPSPLEEEFQYEFTELIDQYKKDFLTHGWSAEELAKWCKEMVDKELRESEDERMRRKTINCLTMHNKGCVDVKDIDECIAWLEKQKEASKAIEAVDRIDKYIDDHLTNAHDMKDSNPDKKYYRGWDDALGKMAGILQDVYSEKENKFAPRVLPCSAAWFEDGDEKQKEQKPVETETIISCNGHCEECSCFNAGRKYEREENKPAEWSEEDEEVMEDLYNFVISDFIQDHIHETRWKPWKTTLERNRQNRLKSLRPQSQGTYKQIVHSIYDMLKDKDFFEIQPSHRVSLLNDIRVKCKIADECAEILDEPHWKPTEEQMKVLNKVVNGEVLLTTQHKSLELLYEQLKKLI